MDNEVGEVNSVNNTEAINDKHNLRVKRVTEIVAWVVAICVIGYFLYSRNPTNFSFLKFNNQQVANQPVVNKPVANQQKMLVNTPPPIPKPPTNSNDPYAYAKGKVISFDLSAGYLTYNPYIMFTLSTTTAKVNFKGEIPMYKIDSEDNLGNINVVKKISSSEIKKSETVFIRVNRKSPVDPNTKAIIPLAIIILKS